METYFEKREQLILEDRALRPDHANHGRRISSQERMADRILRSIRTSEAGTIWGNQASTNLHGSQRMFPGMEFLTARKTILSSKLFHILSKMPKGALLHAHLDATVRADTLLDLALEHPALHVRVSETLSVSNLRSVLPEFRALPRNEWTGLSSITDVNYVLGSWVSIATARDNFSKALGGPAGFNVWVIGALMINPSEAYGTHNTTASIWRKFETTFGVSDGLIRFVPVWTEYVRQFLISSFQDGIIYVEPRILFWFKYMVGEDGQENVPHRIWFEIYERVLKEVNMALQTTDHSHPVISSKIIYSTLRNVSCEELEWYLEDCVELKKQFPHLVAGFDLVGHEDSHKPLLYYLDPLLKFVERQKELGITIPFIFHAGETLGDGTEADMNLYDAILLGTKRIGHGFSIYKHPRLMEICRERQICLEMCPISNEILRLTGSMPMHPLPAILNQGVHVALCSDDPSVFGNMGLSFDFYQVFVASEVNGLSTLHELVWDSITYSSMDVQEKEGALHVLEQRWEAFVDHILQHYGPEERDG